MVHVHVPDQGVADEVRRPTALLLALVRTLALMLFHHVLVQVPFKGKHLIALIAGVAPNRLCWVIPGLMSLEGGIK